MTDEGSDQMDSILVLWRRRRLFVAGLLLCHFQGMITTLCSVRPMRLVANTRPMPSACVSPPPPALCRHAHDIISYGSQQSFIFQCVFNKLWANACLLCLTFLFWSFFFFLFPRRHILSTRGRQTTALVLLVSDGEIPLGADWKTNVTLINEASAVHI